MCLQKQLGLLNILINMIAKLNVTTSKLTAAFSTVTTVHTREVSFRETFSRVNNLNSRELNRFSIGISAPSIPIRRKIVVCVACVEFYLYPTVSTVLIHSVKPELTE